MSLVAYPGPDGSFYLVDEAAAFNWIRPPTVESPHRDQRLVAVRVRALAQHFRDLADHLEKLDRTAVLTDQARQ